MRHAVVGTVGVGALSDDGGEGLGESGSELFVVGYFQLECSR